MKSVIVGMTLCFSLAAQGFTFGGEIPWPIDSQFTVTAENSRGLWMLKHNGVQRLYNVEILDEVEGMTFIRVTEMDYETFQVISWGEGFFRTTTKKKIIGTGFWTDYLDVTTPAVKDVGRYLHMYPNGDILEKPYMLRLVEVRTQIGVALGLSMYPLAGGTVSQYEHSLGSRLQKQPLHCEIDEDTRDGDNADLKCDI
ncbi:MAG: hypothetical protein MJK18_14895 [Bdellovibrionales bacterium]|nr:hypothetical protein [Bdellovibrionales bacterium]